MNFWTRKLAQEALQDEAMLITEIDVVSPEEDVEAALLEVENDTQEIENHDIVADYEDEDATETEERLEALEEETEGEEDISEDRVELIAAAQESIRKRHGFPARMSVARECMTSSKPRRVVARESLWEDIKAFFRKIKDWFIEKMNQLKDRWLKFTNAGKTIQKKCKKFDIASSKLGQKDKDTISGSFIESLTVNSKFEPREVGQSAVDSMDVYCDVIVGATEAPKALVWALQNPKEAAEAAKKEKAKTAAAAKKAAKEVAVEAGPSDSGPSHHAANFMFAVSEDSTITFEKNEKADVPSDVPTPNVAEIRSIITLYNKVGVRLEKSILDWRKREKANNDAVSALKKLEDSLDKIEADDKESRDAVSNVRGAIAYARATISVFDRLTAHAIKHTTKGLNGYIVASIGAYKKAKV